MKVEIHGRAQKFDEIAPGTFFKVMRSDPFFAFAVVDQNGSKGALAFVSAGLHGTARAPRFERGFKSDYLITFGDAVLYASPADALSPGSMPIGAVALCENGFFIRASDGLGSVLAVNIETGFLDASAASPSAVYQKWSVGHWRGRTFEALFSFPESLGLNDPS